MSNVKSLSYGIVSGGNMSKVRFPPEMFFARGGASDIVKGCKIIVFR